MHPLRRSRRQSSRSHCNRTKNTGENTVTQKKERSVTLLNFTVVICKVRGERLCRQDEQKSWKILLILSDASPHNDHHHQGVKYDADEKGEGNNDAAVALDRFGGPETLKVQTVPIPEARRGRDLDSRRSRGRRRMGSIRTRRQVRGSAGPCA
jgi:hypothetical protein